MIDSVFAIGTKAAFSIIIFDKFHSMMGHPCNTVLKETAKSTNIQLTRDP
jgi:hypothetical protein